MRISWPALLVAPLLFTCSSKNLSAQNGPAAAIDAAAPNSSAANAESEINSAKSVLVTGIVSDPSGARIPGATIRINAADNSLSRDLTSDSAGKFATSLPAGAYTVIITAPGFDPFFKDLRVASAAVNLDARLLIAADTIVQVNANSNGLSTSESDNGSQLSYSADQLQVFSDDDATFQQQITAIAGGDGTHPPQIYVDGFSGGNFPPKSAIREIKINQNPYSAEYDQLGFGRIEILTKPGTGRIHGSVDVFGDPSAFNSQSPFLFGAAEPGYYRVHTKGDISGPIDKKTSFFVTADYYDQQNNAIINPTLPTGAISQAIADPQNTGDYTARLDRQWSTNNTATGRYEFNRVGLTNGGLSAQTLASQAYNSTVTTQTLQLGNTQVINPHLEHETKFEWIRTRTQQLAVDHSPTINVTGYFSQGESSAGDIRDNLDHFEFFEKGSLEHGAHFIRAGFRWRMDREANFSNAGFTPSYTYASLATYSANTPSQTSITTGRTSFAASTQDVAFYAEDEWKARKSLTVDLGARFEFQTAIPNTFAPSPHLGLAWALGQKGDKPAPVILRFGSAIFYDRFPIANLLTTVRQGDPTAQTTTITGATTPALTTTYRMAPDLRAEYDVYTGGGAEFSLGKWGGFSANIIQDRGLHQFMSRNANAPQANGIRPYGTAGGNQYEFDSEGRQWSTFFFVNPHINVTKHIALWAFYNIQRNYTDFTGGTSTFVSNSYNTRADYGRNPNMRHMQVFTGGDWDAPHDIHISYFLAARAGQPYNITSPYDNNGDSIFNDRPSYTTAAVDNVNVFNTPYGRLNAKPAASETIIPFDLGHSPAFVSLQVQAKKTWRFGPRISDDPDAPPEVPKPGEKPKLPDPRYSITFAIEAQNLTNTTNPGKPIGVLGSADFGKSIATANTFLTTTAANRTFALHTSFNF